MSAGGLLKKISRLGRADSHPSLLDDSCCLGVGVQCNNAVNGFCAIISPDAIRRIQRVQTVTIAWMSVEAVVSLFAAWRARSPVLLAFGGDSAIEFFSAVLKRVLRHASMAMLVCSPDQP